MNGADISWPQRLLAILIANAVAVLVWSVAQYIFLASAGAPSAISILYALPLSLVIALTFGGGPEILGLWLLLRKSFFPLWVAILGGVLTALCLMAGSIAISVPSRYGNRWELAAQILRAVAASSYILVVIATGAIGGAVVWYYLDRVRRHKPAAPQ